MARREKRPEGSGRLEALLERGDWRGAAAEARRLLADPAAAAADRAAAEEAQARLSPEPGALAAGATGTLAILAAIVFGLVIR